MRARLCELYILGQSLLIAQFLAPGFIANASDGSEHPAGAGRSPTCLRRLPRHERRTRWLNSGDRSA